MKKISQKNLGLILVVSFLILIGVATTYAWLVWSSTNNTELTLTIGDVAEVTYTTGNDIAVTDFGPVLDPEDGVATNFSITRNTIDNLSATIHLDISRIDSGLADKTFKWILYTSDANSSVVLNGNDVTYIVLASGDFSNAGTGQYTLADDVALNPGSTKYKLLMYIDGNEKNSTNMQNKTFTAELNVSVAPPPDLKLSSLKVNNEKSNGLPTSGAYNVSKFDCDSNATMTYNSVSRSIEMSNFEKTWCSVELSDATLLLNDVPFGSFVSYTGNNGCSGTSCSGTNSNASSDLNLNTFGWCGTNSNKYYMTGWMKAYTDDNNYIYLLSASAPECLTKNAADTVETYTNNANAAAIKYCNNSYSASGTCVADDDTNTDAWAMNNTDFWNIVLEFSNGTFARNVLPNYNGQNESDCLSVRSNFACGYGVPIIDNGGYYSFNAYVTNTDTDTVVWDPTKRAIVRDSSQSTYGLRVIVRLKSTIKVTGGTGTMDDPYTISN